MPRCNRRHAPTFMVNVTLACYFYRCASQCHLQALPSPQAHAGHSSTATRTLYSATPPSNALHSRMPKRKDVAGACQTQHQRTPRKTSQSDRNQAVKLEGLRSWRENTQNSKLTISAASARFRPSSLGEQSTCNRTQMHCTTAPGFPPIEKLIRISSPGHGTEYFTTTTATQQRVCEASKSSHRNSPAQTCTPLPWEICPTHICRRDPTIPNRT